jgi:hypothetical protein
VLSKSFEHTLKDSNLHNVSISLAEVLADSLMEDGIAKQIPIIGTVVGLGKTAIGIKESLFQHHFGKSRRGIKKPPLHWTRQ